jgi:hypothetical protein
LPLSDGPTPQTTLLSLCWAHLCEGTEGWGCLSSAWAISAGEKLVNSVSIQQDFKFSSSSPIHLTIYFPAPQRVALCVLFRFLSCVCRDDRLKCADSTVFRTRTCSISVSSFKPIFSKTQGLLKMKVVFFLLLFACTPATCYSH